MTALLVVAGAAVGAPTRFLVDRWARHHSPAGTILGTLIVNVVGSLVLGAVAAASTDQSCPTWLLPLVGVGFCGALTTFSTLQLELIKLARHGEVGLAAGYLCVTLVSGLVGVYLATALTRRVRLS